MRCSDMSMILCRSAVGDSTSILTVHEGGSTQVGRFPSSMLGIAVTPSFYKFLRFYCYCGETMEISMEH